MTYILGISAFYHDSAAAIICNGKIMAAAQEERFTRIKNDETYPTNAIDYVLKETKITLKDISFVVFYDKPFLKFERLLETYLSFAPKGFLSFSKSIPIWLKEKLFLKSFLLKKLKKLDKNFKESKLLFSEHHISHAASSYFTSGFEKSAILIVDGVGEWSTTTIAIGDKNNIFIKKEIKFPHSIGLLYSAFTYYCGFKVNSGEYKLMGLAPYGKPKYTNLILEELIDLKEDGSFKINQEYFNYATGLKMTNQKFSKLFDKPKREANSEMSQFYMDLAASIQEVLEIVLLKIFKYIKSNFNVENICLAGGVALNCVANAKLLKEQIFNNIWIQPAAGDAGSAIGAALAAWHIHLNKPLIKEQNLINGSYLGPSFSSKEIKEELIKQKAIYQILNQNEMLQKTAKELSKGKIVGWFQGRMEFGPRALGNRSILASPLLDDMQKKLNLKIKKREGFRPFAPSILNEKLKEWFEFDINSPYMLFVSNVKKNKLIKEDGEKLEGLNKINQKRSIIPAVTHIDNSARIQTVHKDTNPNYYKLISEFEKITSCPILVNTSFNVRGEPIVCTPKDAFECFMNTDIDILVMENFYLEKDKQKITIKPKFFKED